MPALGPAVSHCATRAALLACAYYQRACVRAARSRPRTAVARGCSVKLYGALAACSSCSSILQCLCRWGCLPTRRGLGASCCASARARISAAARSTPSALAALTLSHRLRRRMACRMLRRPACTNTRIELSRASRKYSKGWRISSCPQCNGRAQETAGGLMTRRRAAATRRSRRAARLEGAFVSVSCLRDGSLSG